MAPSFDYAVSSLLCAEDYSFFYGNNELEALAEELAETVCHNENHHGGENGWSFGGGEALPMPTDECVALMVEKECQYLPGPDYLKRLKNGDLDLGDRKAAVDWILKVSAHFGFGPLCVYLAVNYMDRFLSSYELPKGKAWTMQLLAVACLSLAAKMEETEVPLTLDLQVGDQKYLFEARTMQRMELLVLSTLKWRMQVVTPFSFIDFFLSKIHDDQVPHTPSIARSIQLISSTIQGIDCLEFRPSEIAAAVAICVAGEAEVVDTEKATSLLIHHVVEKERFLNCIKFIRDIELSCRSVKEERATISHPRSPSGVLDVSCLSYKSDNTVVESRANSPHDTPGSKRRRLNRL